MSLLHISLHHLKSVRPSRVKNQKNMDRKHKILDKFHQYISMENLCDGQPSKLNNFFVGQDGSFRKKQLFSDKKYFLMSKTCKNYPGPPSCLKCDGAETF